MTVGNDGKPVAGSPTFSYTVPDGITAPAAAQVWKGIIRADKGITSQGPLPVVKAGGNVIAPLTVVAGKKDPNNQAITVEWDFQS